MDHQQVPVTALPRFPQNRTLIANVRYHHLLGRILDAVDQSSALEQERAHNGNGNQPNPTGWSALSRALFDLTQGILRGYNPNSLPMSGTKPVSSLRARVVALLAMMNFIVKGMASNVPKPALLLRGQQMHKQYYQFCAKQKSEAAAKKAAEQLLQARMDHHEMGYGMQPGGVNSNLTRRPPIVATTPTTTTQFHTTIPTIGAHTTTTPAAATTTLSHATIRANTPTLVIATTTPRAHATIGAHTSTNPAPASTTGVRPTTTTLVPATTTPRARAAATQVRTTTTTPVTAIITPAPAVIPQTINIGARVPIQGTQGMDPYRRFQDQIPYRLGVNEALQDATSQATSLIHGMNSNRNPGNKIGGIAAQAAAC